MTNGFSRRSAVWFYAATTFISAFLLFQVQPIISKAILPWFGGSPAVWTTAMLFFQTILFAGYAYAHFAQRLRPATQAAVHVALLAIAVAIYPILPGPSWKPIDGTNPAGRILLLLAVCVGLPYFVLSATGPAGANMVCARLSGPFAVSALFIVERRLIVGAVDLSVSDRAAIGNFLTSTLLGNRLRRVCSRVRMFGGARLVDPPPGSRICRRAITRRSRTAAGGSRRAGCRHGGRWIGRDQSVWTCRFRTGAILQSPPASARSRFRTACG